MIDGTKAAARCGGELAARPGLSESSARRIIHSMARTTTRLWVAPTTWSGRLLVAGIGVALLICAFFFLTFALVIASLLILVALVRMLFPRRKVHESAARQVIDGEYSVEAEGRDPTSPASEIQRQRLTQPGPRA